MFVGPEQPQLGLQEYLFYAIVLIISVLLAILFEYKKAEEERQRQTVLYVQQAVFQLFSQGMDVVAGSLASALNVLLQHAKHFFQAAGIQAGLPSNTVTPEGVIFVAKWVLLLLICYWLIAIASVQVNFLLSRLWWLLKVGVAVACFGLILNDHGVRTEIIRLMCLGYICILFSIRPWTDQTMATRIVHLEEQVKILENRVREMERWRRCVILSHCLMMVFCVLALIAFRGYTFKSNSKDLEI